MGGLVERKSGRRWVHAWLLLLVLLAGSCGGGDTPGAAPAPTSTSAPATAAPPTTSAPSTTTAVPTASYSSALRMASVLSRAGFDCGTDELVDDEYRAVGLVSVVECANPDLFLGIYASERDRLSHWYAAVVFGCSGDDALTTVAYVYGTAWLVSLDEPSTATASDLAESLAGSTNVVDCATHREEMQVFLTELGGDFLEQMDAMEVFFDEAPISDLKALLGE